MTLKNQLSAMQDLKSLANKEHHNVLITGISQSGKTYLAKEYAKLLNVHDFILLDPKIGEIKSYIESALSIDTPQVVCIENLDTGVKSTSYTLLKFLEEVHKKIYIIITCRNIKYIPDTIISRCSLVSVPAMLQSDLIEYGHKFETSEFDKIYNDKSVWNAVKSAKDIDILVTLDETQINYIKNIKDIIQCKSAISNMMWKFQKFPDGTNTPVEFLIKYLMCNTDSGYVKHQCYICLNEMSYGRLPVHVILAKFLMNIKYNR